MGLLNSFLSTLLQEGLRRWLSNSSSNALGSTAKSSVTNIFDLSDDFKELKYMWEKLPQYPLWTVGGSDFDLYDCGGAYDEMRYKLTLKGTKKMLDAYKTLLLSQGFRRVTQYSDIDAMAKMINGECYAFIYTDAICDDEIEVIFEKNIEYRPD